MALLNPKSWFTSGKTEEATKSVVLERVQGSRISGRGKLYVTLTPHKHGAWVRFDDHNRPEFRAEIGLTTAQLRWLLAGGEPDDEAEGD